MAGKWDDSGGAASINVPAGSAAAVGSGAFSIIALYNTDPVTSFHRNFAIGGYASSTQVREVISSANAIFGTGDFSSGVPVAWGTSEWWLIGMTKPAGSAPYRIHLWKYAADGSGAMSHSVATGAANHGDGSALTQVRLGNADVNGNGDIALAGLWTSELTDAQVAFLATSHIARWVELSPKMLLTLNGWNGSAGSLVDLMNPSLSGVTVTGSVGTAADPASFDFVNPVSLFAGSPIYRVARTAVDILPNQLNTSDAPAQSQGLTLGTNFALKEARKVAALRWYRPASNTDAAAQLALLDVATGSILAQGTAPIAGVDGYVEYVLPAPLSLAAATDYRVIAAFHDQHYSYRTGVFPGGGEIVDNGDLFTNTAYFAYNIGVALPTSSTDFNWYVDVRLATPSAGQSISLGLPVESDSALAVSLAKTRLLGLPSEIDSALSLSGSGTAPAHQYTVDIGTDRWSAGVGSARFTATLGAQ